MWVNFGIEPVLLVYRRIFIFLITLGLSLALALAIGKNISKNQKNRFFRLSQQKSTQINFF